jgi:hypothetical protein
MGGGVFGQTFQPNAQNLTQVDASFLVNAMPLSGGSLILLLDSAGSTVDSLGPLLVPGPSPGELFRTVSFQFSSPHPLNPLETYTIFILMSGGMTWEFAYESDQAVPYSRGQAVIYDGTPINPPADFVFTTYYQSP